MKKVNTFPFNAGKKLQKYFLTNLNGQLIAKKTTSFAGFLVWEKRETIDFNLFLCA